MIKQLNLDSSNAVAGGIGGFFSEHATEICLAAGIAFLKMVGAPTIPLYLLGGLSFSAYRINASQTQITSKDNKESEKVA